MSSLIVNINPKILEWARVEAGFDNQTIAAKISVQVDRYNYWEATGKDIPFGKLKELGKQYKRQAAVFLLEEVPQKNTKPKDYRNINPEDAQLTPPTLLAMRRANKYQEMIIELESKEYWEKRYSWQAELTYLKGDNEIIDWLRGKLKIDIQDQYKFKNANEAYKKWRNSIEDNLGILTFQFPMKVGEVQGFCYTNLNPYAIVTNANYTDTSKIFTLFHELGHILRHQSGICLPDNVSKNQTEEFNCNHFAGTFLLPLSSLVVTIDPTEILTLSRKLKISSEVYLRRMLEENKINDSEFFRLLEVIRKSVKIKKSFGIATPTQKSLNQRGQSFFNAVLDGANKNKISYSRASDALSLAIKYLIKN